MYSGNNFPFVKIFCHLNLQLKGGFSLSCKFYVRKDVNLAAFRSDVWACVRKRKKLNSAKLFTLTQAVHTPLSLLFTHVKFTRQWESTLKAFVGLESSRWVFSSAEMVSLGVAIKYPIITSYFLNMERSRQHRLSEQKMFSALSSLWLSRTEADCELAFLFHFSFIGLLYLKFLLTLFCFYYATTLAFS